MVFVQVIFVDGLMGDSWAANALISDAGAPECTQRVLLELK